MSTSRDAKWPKVEIPDSAKEQFNRIKVASRGLIQKQLDEIKISIPPRVYNFDTSLILPDYLIESITEFQARAGAGFQQYWSKILPANWPENSLGNLDRFKEVLAVDGIPIVHVPRAEIVTEILKAPDFAARMNIIDTRSDEIAVDCKEVLSSTFHTEIEKQAPLALEAAEAFLDGHYAAAQALAVLVCDTYLKAYLGGTIKTPKGKDKKIGYPDMAKAVDLEAIDQENPLSIVLKYNYALGPVASFLTEWWPEDPTKGPKPTKLSRHVSVHNASTDDMHKNNAIVAVMLAASLTVGIDIWERY